MANVQILQDIAYSSLPSKARQYKKWKRIDNILYVICFSWTFIWLAIMIIVLFPLPPPPHPPLNPLWLSVEFALSALVGIAPLSLDLLFGERKEKKANLEDDEWVRFYSGSIVIDLEEFVRKRDSERKEECRKSALKNAYGLLSVVDHWDIGNFLPVETYVGDSVDSFRKNLSTKIIPSLREGNDEELARASQIMQYMFTVARASLTIAGIKAINAMISKRFLKERQFKIGFSVKISNFFRTRSILRHIVVVVGFVAISVISAYLALASGMTKDTAGIILITLFVGLLVVYYTRQRPMS